MSETTIPPVEDQARRAEARRERRRRDSIGWGVTLIIVGLALFAKEMGWITFRWHWILPAILVWIGSSYVLHGLKDRS